MPFAATWLDLGIIRLSETERQIPYDTIYMGNLNYGASELLCETETDSQHREENCSGRGMDWESGISRNKLLYIVVIVVRSPSHVQHFVSPRTAARQASLSLTISRSLPKFMSIIHRMDKTQVPSSGSKAISTSPSDETPQHP